MAKVGALRVIGGVALSAFCLVTSYAQPGGENQPTEDASDQIAEAVEVIPSIDSDIILQNEEEALQHKFARVEASLNQAYRAQLEGKEAQASQYFDTAYALLLGVRSENLHPGAPEPLVRDRNLQRGKYFERTSGELWRPLSMHFNVWLAQFPKHYHDDFNVRYDVDARAMLRHAREKAEPTLMRSMVSSYFYTDTGFRAFHQMLREAAERGDFLEVVVLAMQLREMRPYLYRSHPMVHAYLLVALERLGDDELLEIEREFGESTFANLDLRVGAERVSYRDALEALRSALVVDGGSKRRERSVLVGLEEAKEYLLAVSSELFESNGSANSKIVDRTLPEPLFTGMGVIVPHLDSSLFWFPSLGTNQSRTLSLSLADANQFEAERTSNRYRYNYSNNSSLPDARIIGARVFETIEEHSRSDSAYQANYRRWLVAVLGTGVNTKGKQSGNQIQVFDLHREGAIVGTLPRRDEEAGLLDELERTHFGGLPVVSENTLYVTGSVSLKDSSELMLHAFSVDAKSPDFGKLLWRTKIAGLKDEVMQVWWGSGNSAPLIEASSITLSGNRLFVTTNGGAVGCYDARDGEALWVVKYRRRQTGRRWGWNYVYDRSARILPAPVELYGVTAVCTPNDARHGFSLSAYDGNVLRPLLANTDRTYEEAGFFIGVYGGYAYFQTANILEAEPVTYSGVVRSADGKLKYGKPLKAGDVPRDLMEQIDGRGRAVVAGSSILLPGRDGVLRFDLETLEFVGFVAWPDAVPDSDGEPSASPSEERAQIPGLVSLHWFERDGQAYLVRLDLRSMKIYPATLITQNED